MISETLKSVTQLTIQKTNEALSSDHFLNLFGCGLSDMTADDDQPTQSQTKFLQYILNQKIVESMKELGVNGVSQQRTGYDYLIEDMKVEFKLMGGSAKDSFATGNKTSFYGGAKVSLVWSIKYVLTDNQISHYAAALVNTNKMEGTVWNAGAGRNDSYSTLKVEKNDILAVELLAGNLVGAQKYLHLIPTTNK